MVAVARGKHHIDDADRRQPAQSLAPVAGIDGQAVLQPLQFGAESLELRSLRLVAHRDERLECGLVIEPAVFVHLVRPDCRLDRRIQFHPGDIARVVVVGCECIRARLEECLERRLRRGRRRIAQVPCHFGQFALVLETVGHRDEFPGRIAADGREETCRRRLLGGREALEPAFDVRLGRSHRVEVGSLRLRRRARDENGVVIEPRPRPAIDEEIVESRPAERRRVLHEPEQHRLVACPHLLHEQHIGDTRCLDQACERLLFALRQSRKLDPDFDRRKTRGHPVEAHGLGWQAHFLLAQVPGSVTATRRQAKASWQFPGTCADAL